MKIIFSFLVLSAILAACNPPSSSPNLEEKFLDKTLYRSEDNIGPVVLTIDFQLKAKGEDLKTFEDGLIPWISIEDPASEIENLVAADSVVLPVTVINLIIDYPLENPAFFKVISTGGGFTRKQLITFISEKYHEIYKLEESTASTKTIPAEERKGLMNRNETDGKYGVWGHDISDLDLSGIEVHKDSKGKATLTLNVES